MPQGPIDCSDILGQEVACNLLTEDVTAINGPLRHIPRTQRRPLSEIPSPYDEPNEWLLSTMQPASAGTVMIRDIRTWHGGTPNLSTRARPLPNIEFYAPWLVEKWKKEENHAEYISKVMPFEIWEGLSERAKKVA